MRGKIRDTLDVTILYSSPSVCALIKSKYNVTKLLFFISITLAFIFIGTNKASASSTYQSWNIPENTAYASKVAPFGGSFVAPNGNYWFLTSATGNYRILNYVDANTGVIVNTPAYFKYTCCSDGSPSPQDDNQSYFITDITGKVWYTGADYSVYEVILDAQGNPTSFGNKVWLPPATGQGAFGGTNWGPLYMQVGPDDSFWYVNGGTNIKNTQQDGTLIQQFTAPSTVSGMQLDASGNLWISTDTTGSVAISKLNIATGIFTTYPLDYSKGYNLTLETIGPDGNMWFIHDNINIQANPMAVGKITPSGIVTYINGLTASNITIGHANNIVLTSNGFNKIQMLDVLTEQLTAYGQSNQEYFHLLTKSSIADEYWYVSKNYPKLSGYTGSASYSVTKAKLSAKNTAASIISPGNNSYFTTDSVLVKTQISDPDGISSVSLFVNGLPSQTVNNPTSTQTINWDASSLTDNHYLIFIRVQDSQGNTEDSTIITVAIDRNSNNGITPGLERNVINKLTTNGSLDYIIEGPDKNIWGMYNGNKIFRFEPCSATFSEYASPTTKLGVPVYSTTSEMISGSDGYIWYVDRDNSGISRISTDGVITQFPSLPITAESNPGTFPPKITGLVEDNNGNIWYTAFADKKVGYIDKNGVYVGGITLAYSPKDIALGSDGFVWITQGTGTGTKISKIDPATKAVTSYTAPQFNTSSTVNLNDIELGVDGNIWYTANQPDNDFIGRVSSDGVFTNYSLPSLSDPINITPDPVGNKMWFTYAGNDGLGYIDLTNNSIHDYVNTLLLNTISDIKAGSDGSIWYALRDFGSSLGRVNLGKPVDCNSPAVSITAPLNNSPTKNTTLPVSISSSDDTSVTSIQLYHGLSLLTTLTNPSSSEVFNWDITSLSDGKYELSAVAKDGRNNQSTSDKVYFIVDRTKPSMTFTSPLSGETVSEITPINVSASDVNGIASAEFRVNGVSIGTDITAPFSNNWNTSKYSNGTYTLSVTVTDNAGNFTTISRGVTIKNKEVSSDITICHFPGSLSQKTLSVNQSAFPGHISHGDYVGACRPIKPVNNASSVPNAFNTINDIEELEGVVTEKQSGSKVTSTIQSNTDLSSFNIALENNETLVVNGLLGDVNLSPGATIKGNGKIKNLSVQQGAYLSPGESPGCLTTEGLLLEGTYTFELGGALACTEHDQVIVNGSVELRGSLGIALSKSYKPEVSQSYIIITNDGSDAVGGIFTGITEGTSTSIDGVTYSVSYKGGDGNDVEITVVGVEDNQAVVSVDSNDAVNKPQDSDSNIIIFIMVVVALNIVIVTLVILRKQNK